MGAAARSGPESPAPSVSWPAGWLSNPCLTQVSPVGPSAGPAGLGALPSFRPAPQQDQPRSSVSRRPLALRVSGERGWDRLLPACKVGVEFGINAFQEPKYLQQAN